MNEEEPDNELDDKFYQEKEEEQKLMEDHKFRMMDYLDRNPNLFKR